MLSYDIENNGNTSAFKTNGKVFDHKCSNSLNNTLLLNYKAVSYHSKTIKLTFQIDNTLNKTFI